MALNNLTIGTSNISGTGSTPVSGLTAGSTVVLTNNPENAFTFDGANLRYAIVSGMPRTLHPIFMERIGEEEQQTIFTVNVAGTYAPGPGLIGGLNTPANLTALSSANTALGVSQTPTNVTSVSFTVPNDPSQFFVMNNAAAQIVTINSGLSAWPVGSVMTFLQIGAGLTTIAPGAGVTIDKSSTLLSKGKGAIQVIKLAADNYFAIGNLS